jgi:hypothetical protein
VTASPVDSGEVGAPMNEIEITPTIIRAGARILEDFYDALPSSAESHAELIFKEMFLASPGEVCQDFDETPLFAVREDENRA